MFFLCLCLRVSWRWLSAAEYSGREAHLCAHVLQTTPHTVLRSSVSSKPCLSVIITILKDVNLWVDSDSLWFIIQLLCSTLKRFMRVQKHLIHNEIWLEILEPKNYYLKRYIFTLAVYSRWCNTQSCNLHFKWAMPQNQTPLSYSLQSLHGEKCWQLWLIQDTKVWSCNFIWSWSCFPIHMQNIPEPLKSSHDLIIASNTVNLQWLSTIFQHCCRIAWFLYIICFLNWNTSGVFHAVKRASESLSFSHCLDLLMYNLAIK